MKQFGFLILATLCVFACSPKSEHTQKNPDPLLEQVSPDLSSIETALNGQWRNENDTRRDRFRHPAQTMDFCQIDPSGHIIEVWPGGGWYSKILIPWIHANGGQFTAAIVDPQSSPRAAELSKQYLQQFTDTQIFGKFAYNILSQTSPLFTEAESQDSILTFRNIHSWMDAAMAEKTFADFYAALKPGGILCVVQHRLPSGEVQSPTADTGYVQEAMVKALATGAGFVFDAASEINANAKDTADHPFGVWTLPPTKASPKTEAARTKYPDFDRARYDAIGESDRMTMRFRKPLVLPSSTP